MNGEHNFISRRELAGLNVNSHAPDQHIKNEELDSHELCQGNQVSVIVDTGRESAIRRFNCSNPEKAEIILSRILEGYFE